MGIVLDADPLVAARAWPIAAGRARLARMRALRWQAAALVGSMAWLLSACGSSNSTSSGGAACRYISVGNSGSIACSADGASWSARTSGTDQDLLGVGANKNGSVVVVGRGGTVLYSNDGAATFQKATSPTSGDLEAVVADDTGRLVIAGNDTRAYTSDDGGKTWTPSQAIDAADQVLITALASDGGARILAAGAAYGTTVQNHVYLSADGGDTWSSVYAGPAESVGGSLTDTLEGVAADGAHHYVTVGMSSEALYASGSSPSSWATSDGFVQGLTVGGVAWDASDREFVAAAFGATANQQVIGGVYVSADDGKTFNQICTSLSDQSAAHVTAGGGRIVALNPGSAIVSSDGGASCKLVHVVVDSNVVGSAVAYVP
jgi:Photosynthesis system II assembly factor YCF48